MAVLMAVLMLAAQSLFLWMFFSTQGLEQMADAGALPVARETAYRYAAQWRHGLAGEWPLFVPGFFAVAVATWFWAFGRSLQNLLPRLAGYIVAATLVALVLSGVGGDIVLRDFLRETGVFARAAPAWPSVGGIGVGMYTIAAWNAVILAAHRALWWRSPWPLAVPAAMDAVLMVIRPFTFGDLVNTWWERTANGDPIAVVSLAAVPVLATWMAICHFSWEGGQHHRSRFSCALQGHAVDSTGACACGVALSATSQQPVRVWHNLRCFLGRHRYRFILTRDGHNEYRCVRCGHPLLLRSDTNPLPVNVIFSKAVHYRCGLTGHHVHIVAKRDGGTEYACDCGHSFLLQDDCARKIRHPSICVLCGHRLTFLGRRAGYEEYLCGICGHPFLFGTDRSCPAAEHTGRT
jgi:DNA-directed RNA polymerase subunit RPC12/RpoP